MYDKGGNEIKGGPAGVESNPDIVILPPTGEQTSQSEEPMLAENSDVVERELYDAARAEKEAWKFRATHDDLTLVRNRKGLQLEFDRLDSEGAAIAALFVDCDNIKSINENLGHAKGDSALVATAKVLESCVRDEDVVARIGGDEFIVLLAESYRPDREQLPIELERRIGITLFRLSPFLQYLKDADPELAAEGFDLAVGYAIRTPGMSFDELKIIADQRMQRDKIDRLPHLSTVQHEVLYATRLMLEQAGIPPRDAAKYWRTLH